MQGEQYQPDVLHPGWAPGAVAPLPSYVPEGMQYTLQYSSSESNADFYTSSQPQVSWGGRPLARSSAARQRGARGGCPGWRAGLQRL